MPTDAIVNFLHTPAWRKQHGWRRAIWRMMARVGLTGIYGMPLSRRWVQIERLRMPLPHLDPAFEGFKLVQISDLHLSPMVWPRYLIQYLRWINDMQPDLVVVTGDLITGGYRYAERVARLLSHLHATHGIICTLGNHDYGMHGKRSPGEATRRGDHLAAELQRRGLTVLRNQQLQLMHGEAKAPLTIVGLDDEWSGKIDPARAFADVDPRTPIVCLNHNPANVRELLPFPWHWMLAGHTHGRAIATTKFGQTFYARRYRHYTRGYYEIEGRHLYVNRGLSYGQRVRDWCRPEITVFRLTGEKQTALEESSAAALPEGEGKGVRNLQPA